MKEKIRLILVVLLTVALTLLLVSKPEKITEVIEKGPQKLELTISSDKPVKVDSLDRIKEIAEIPSRTMSVDNPQASFSGMTKMVGDVGWIKIYGNIGMAEGTYLFSDYMLLREKYNCSEVKIFINSGGGSAFDGFAVTDLIKMMKDDGVNVEMWASGVVASAAVPIFSCASKRIATKSCIFMVHKARLFKYLSQESIDDLESQKNMMKLMRKRYLDIMEENTTLDRDTWERSLEKTVWFDAKQALEWGLVDEIR